MNIRTKYQYWMDESRIHAWMLKYEVKHGKQPTRSEIVLYSRLAMQSVKQHLQSLVNNGEITFKGVRIKQPTAQAIEREKRKKRVYNYVIEYKIAHNGNSPSFQDIAKKFRFTNSSSTAYVKMLIEDGLLGQIDGTTRSITVNGFEWVRR
jgi:predicted transcriptional regulator